MLDFIMERASVRDFDPEKKIPEKRSLQNFLEAKASFANDLSCASQTFFYSLCNVLAQANCLFQVFFLRWSTNVQSV